MLRWQNGRQPGGPAPLRPPAQERPTRPPEQPVRHRAIAGLLLGLLSVFSLLGVIVSSNFQRSIYLLVFGILVGFIACWFGLSAMRKAARSGTMRPRWAMSGTVVGSVGAVLGGLTLVFFISHWSQLNTYSQCLNSANTPSAQQACQNQLQRSVKIGG
jgi:Mn2+/Fe2+ NRAMP family transporter